MNERKKLQQHRRRRHHRWMVGRTARPNDDVCEVLFSAEPVIHLAVSSFVPMPAGLMAGWLVGLLCCAVCPFLWPAICMATTTNNTQRQQQQQQHNLYKNSFYKRKTETKFGNMAAIVSRCRRRCAVVESSRGLLRQNIFVCA